MSAWHTRTYVKGGKKKKRSKNCSKVKEIRKHEKVRRTLEKRRATEVVLGRKPEKPQKA